MFCEHLLLILQCNVMIVIW